MTHTKSDILDVRVVLHAETDRAVKVSLDETSEATWLPKSQIEIDSQTNINGTVICSLQIPQWLAEKRGLA